MQKRNYWVASLLAAATVLPMVSTPASAASLLTNVQRLFGVNTNTNSYYPYGYSVPTYGSYPYNTYNNGYGYGYNNGYTYNTITNPAVVPGTDPLIYHAGTPARTWSEKNSLIVRVNRAIAAGTLTVDQGNLILVRGWW